MEDRNQLFQKLKPSCVALSQATLLLTARRGSVHDVEKRLDDLAASLKNAAKTSDSLDAKLADYVFFPLSQVLKVSQNISIRCLELSLECLGVLLQHGWRAQIQSQLAGQALILCTLLAEMKPKRLTVADTTDELQRNALICLRHLFTSIRASDQATVLLAGDDNVPQLGQTISVILEAIIDGRSAETQISAAQTLRDLEECLRGNGILVNFLPGIVSNLAKMLTPQTFQRRNHRVLVECLHVITTLLSNLVSDNVSDIAQQREIDISNGTSAKTVASTPWLKVASEQLRPALAGIMRLREHSRLDVRDAISALCVALLQFCRKSLANCSRMALETLISFVADESNVGTMSKVQLQSLVRFEASIAALVQTILYDWLQSLPRIMQSPDERTKANMMQQIGNAYELLIISDVESPISDRLISEALRDSIVVMLQLSASRNQTVSDSSIGLSNSSDSATGILSRNLVGYPNALSNHHSQEQTFQAIAKLTEQFTSTHEATFVPEVMKVLRQSQGDSLLAGYYLAYTALSRIVKERNDINALMSIDSVSSANEYLEELYSFALSVLDSSNIADVDGEPHPRVQALALRTVGLRAEVTGEQFRYELVDALYPVLHALATQDAQLQHDSIVTLNIITRACGYGSAEQLIVENVDYLTNAVALKLNAFDVSPQAPQVLLMMVKLAGPALLPYLVDTVDSIFAILEDYHGYDLLVELLFKVLGVVAEEGAKTRELAQIEDIKSMAHITPEPRHPAALTITSLAEVLRDREATAAESARLTQGEADKPKSHPKRPWSETHRIDADDSDAEQSDDGEQDHSGQDRQMEEAEVPVPAPKTYNLLFKITELTQHFLPSASPSLRSSLLALIRTTVPAIAKHENSFLPLINTLWPEIVARLDDEEAHVRATTLGIVGILCEYAGDFMRSRIIQLWPALLEMHQKLAKDIVEAEQPQKSQRSARSSTALISAAQLNKAIVRMQSSPADYTNTTLRAVWEALVGLLTIIVRNVPLSAEAFDEALDMLKPVLDRAEVLAALERVNADAVWLARLRMGTESIPPAPVSFGGYSFPFLEVR